MKTRLVPGNSLPTTSSWTQRLGMVLGTALTLSACDVDAPQYLEPLGGGSFMTTTDIPCDVNSVLQKNCQACHGSPPVAAPIALVSFQDLTAPSQVDPTKKVIERAVLRMQGTPTPMPPAPAAAIATADIQILQNWIAAGTPLGSCTIIGAATCSSGLTWSGTDGSSRMNPGQACITCHKSEEGPIFQIAGTVYPSLHESDKCISQVGSSGATVVITDATGKIVTLAINSSGNFSYGGSRRTSALQLPFTAKVVANGKERAMLTPQTNGDCNSCHTVGGANGAPGRIMAP